MHISDVIDQAAQLMTVSGIAFAFLLDIAVTYAFKTFVGDALVTFALMCTASAIIVFLLPLLYIQLRFPIDKKQILYFYVWSHRFILCGTMLFVAGIYSSVCLAVYKLIGWSALIIAAGVLLLPLIIYMLRGIGSPIELA